MDPYWTELLKRYAAIPGLQTGSPATAPPPPPGHMPGIYPPANLNSDLIARERERLERLGIYKIMVIDWKLNVSYLL